MKNLLTLLALVTSTILLAQKAEITGTVYDDSGSPLEFANVLLMSAGDSTLYKGTVSEAGGHYALHDVSYGDYYIETSLVGLGSGTSAAFVVQKNHFEVPALKLQNGIEMEEITVTAKKPFIELKADKMVVNVANSAVNAGSSALEVLEKSPGITIDNNDNIILRGKQGVLVTINGKNQYMSGTEITRLLESMPSSNIQSVEIITNPSAKYDAEGNTGIINIVLKKNEKIGSNGSASSTFRQGLNTSHFHSLGLNYRSERLNVYGQGEYYNWGYSQDIDLRRNISYQDGITRFMQLSEMSEVGDGYNAKIGLDYSISDATTLGFMTKRNVGDEQDFNINNTNITGDNMPAFSKLAVDMNDNEDYASSTYNLNLTHKFNKDGLELTLDADMSDYRNDQLSNYDNFYRDNNNDEVADPFFLRNNQVIEIDIFAATADMKVPVSKELSFETGVKVSQVSTMANTLFESFQDDEWIDEIQRSNDFMYDEDVYAAYLNGNTTLAGYMVQAGLRLEHTKSRGMSATVGTDIPRSYTDLFPSISISRQLGKKHNLSLSYSKRLERPNYKDLNPFEDYLDQYTFERGNPLLNPQYSDAVGLTYALGNALFVAANYSHTTDAITEILEQNSATNTTFKTEANVDDTNSGSLTISVPRVWAEWWTMRINYTGFYNEFNSLLSDGNVLDNSSFGHNINLNNELLLGNGYNLEVSGFYQSRLVYGQLDIMPKGSVDMGISKRFLDGKLNVKVGVDDIFYTRNSGVSIDQEYINFQIHQERDTRRVKVNVSYSFGNEKVKRARNRKTSSSTESDRI